MEKRSFIRRGNGKVKSLTMNKENTSLEEMANKKPSGQRGALEREIQQVYRYLMEGDENLLK